MKAVKGLIVIGLFVVVGYMALSLKKRIVQHTCNSIGRYTATKGKEVTGNDDKEWYCCPDNKDINASNCIFYGE